MVQIKKITANIWEYKVDNNANIADFCVFVKTQIECFVKVHCR